MPKYDVNNCAVSSLLASIKAEEIAIPEIQRPFVWDSTKVRDLIDSLYNGFPVGYIIVWQNPDVKLKDGRISQGKKVLIDGQQRITALTAAIVGNEVINSNYKRVPIRIAFNPLEEKFEVLNPAIQKDSIWIPDISKVFDGSFNAFGFVHEYSQANNITDWEQQKKLSDIITKLMSIQNNNLGMITLSHELDIDTVTEIFIRINSKGVVLSQADFAMSKISSNENYGGNYIRKMVDYFCHLKQEPTDYVDIKKNDAEFAKTIEFASIEWVAKETEDLYIPDYTDVLRVAFTYKFHRGRISDLVNLLSGRDFETREYKEEIAETSFKELHDGVIKVVNETNFKRYIMILKSIGIVNAHLVRSQNVLNFGYILYLTLREKGIDANRIESIVRRWLVLTMLTGRYSGSPESRFDYDIKRFVDYENPEEYLTMVEAGELSEAFWEHVLVQRLDTSVASNPYFNVYLMAQGNAKDKGFLSTHIDVQSMLEQRGDVHHLFPKKYLQKNGITSRGMYNQVANYVYLQQEINIKIKDDAPFIYMREVLKQCETKKPVYGGIVDHETLKQNLKDNCIPEEFCTMSLEDYPEFLAKRRVLMAEKIHKYYLTLS